jgi:monofunctional biosynthetic peptidoglycan transglycosylase
MGKKRKTAFRRRLFRGCLTLVAGCVALSFVQVIGVKWIDPPITPTMVYSWLRGDGVRFEWSPLSRISPFLQQAVLASEDQNFFRHRGFDWRQIEQAIEAHGEGRRLRGASTITMQVARNLYLWQGRSWLRKGLEAYYTVLIELLWPKERILEVYLNVAEMGRGIFGAEAAALHSFGRPASRLSRSEAALLAAALPNPRRWSPAHPTSYLLRRQAEILRQMERFEPANTLSSP